MTYRYLLIICFFLFSNEQASAALKVIILDQDTSKGIPADVTMIVVGPPQRNLDIGTTDEDGLLEASLANCSLGDEISVHPLDADYAEPTSPLACNKTTITLKLRSLARIDHIERVATHAEAAQDFGRAAQAINELNASHPDAQLQQRLYVNTAKALGLPEAAAVIVDTQQSKPVPTPELVDRLKEYQATNDLKVTGMIDSRTLAVLGNGPVSTNVLFQAGQ